MKKRKILLSVLAPVAGVAIAAGAVGGSLMLSSCSSNSKRWNLNPTINKYNVNFKTQKNVEKISNYNLTNIDRPTILDTPSNHLVDDGQIDANFNKNPFENIKNQLERNINNIIESDLNDVILEFLSCMEQEDNSENDLELEIAEKEDIRWKNPIKVVNVKLDENFLTTKKINVTANVKVKYEYEIGEREYEGIKDVQNVNFDLYVEFAGKDEILKLTNKVFGKGDQNIGNKEMDYEDIMELLVGERKSKNPFDFDFDDLFDRKDSSIDDIGLLKYMSNFNDITNSNGKMFGYSFDVKDFWDNLGKKWTKQIPEAPRKTLRSNLNKNDFYFWAPSTALCNIFVPQLNNGLDTNTAIKKITKDYQSLSHLQNDLTNIVGNNSNNDYQLLRNWLIKYVVKIPSEMQIKSATLKKENGFGGISKLELEIRDQFGNDFDIEFYSNWWSRR